ncbi:MAG: low temperature requirement protein A [Actinobacteria bacterium]|nr:low temperature requirement protein A [Actinomycetota bacterium]
MELFFDLVFVFAVSQLSDHLLTHLNWRGAGETAVLLVAVFSVWAYTSFEATSRDVERKDTQRTLLAVMFLFVFCADGSVTGPDLATASSRLLTCGTRSAVTGLLPRGLTVAACPHAGTVVNSVLIAMASPILRATGHLATWKPCTRSTTGRSVSPSTVSR